MKKIPCSYDLCGIRRTHWEKPDQLRGTPVLVEVPDDYTGRVYCSIECAAYAGEFKRNVFAEKAMSLKTKDKQLSNPLTKTDFHGIIVHTHTQF
jgi:hypothetical protein